MGLLLLHVLLHEVAMDNLRIGASQLPCCLPCFIQRGEWEGEAGAGGFLVVVLMVDWFAVLACHHFTTPAAGSGRL